MNINEINVYKFLKTFVLKFFSENLFGKNNTKVINSYIKKIVCLKKYESFNI